MIIFNKFFNKKIKHQLCSDNCALCSDTCVLFPEQRGSGILEVLLVMAVIAVLAPFVYNRVSETTLLIRDMSVAKAIIGNKIPALSFVKLNQDKWPDFAQIKLSPDELQQISPNAKSGFIDKYPAFGGMTTDIYLAFNMESQVRAASVARSVGTDAAAVGTDGVAYGGAWAVQSEDFAPGDLVYRISHDHTAGGRSKYLHRSSSGKDEFNVMQRNLLGDGFDIYEIGAAVSNSVKSTDAASYFINAKQASVVSAYFVSGANLGGGTAKFGSVRVSGDTTGFRNITAARLNDVGFSAKGSVIADRANISRAVHVGKNLELKSDSARTVSGFLGVTTHSLYTPYISANELSFMNGFGLTVSGELLMSSTAPLKLGSWNFPGTNPPRFANLNLSRARIPAKPNKEEFAKIIKSGWKTIQSTEHK